MPKQWPAVGSDAPARCVQALATTEESAPVAAEADAPQNGAADAPAQPPQLSQKWQDILDVQANGTVCSGKIRGFNKAGVVLDVPALRQRGFVPWGKLDLTRLPGPDPSDEDRKKLYGQEVSAKVVQVGGCARSWRGLLQQLLRGSSCTLGLWAGQHPKAADHHERAGGAHA